MPAAPVAALQTVSADQHAALHAALAQDGAVIVRNFIPADQLATLQADIDVALDAVPWCNTVNAYADSFFGQRTKRLHGVAGLSDAAGNLLRHPLALATATALLGERLVLSTAEVMAIGPGEQRQALHRDADSWRRSGFTAEREILFSVNVALTDFSCANGATVVLPGSHGKARADVDESEFCQAEMAAGSALFYTGRVLHGGGANVTSDTRTGLYFGYVPTWLRPLENAYATLSADCIARLDDELARLLGIVRGGFIADL